MEDPEDPEKRQITVLAQKAVIALEKCLQVSGSFSHLAEAQLARFNLWATNIGVFAKYKASLEYRLRDSPDVQRIIINLLEILALYAGQALRTELEVSSPNNEEASRSEVSTQCETTIPGHDISNTIPYHSDFQMQPLNNLSIVPAYQAVEDTITRLHHLSTAIRNAGVRNPYSRITRLIILDEDGNDINQAFESFISQVLKLRHSRLSEALRSRLADAICFRRRRFLYNKPSAKKYQGGFVAPVLPSGRGVHHIPTPPASRKRPSIPDAPLPPPAQALTTRTASTFYPQRFQYPRLSEPSVVSTATPSSHIPQMNEHIPKPPSVASGQKEAQCPFCPFVINIKYLTGTRWIKHFQDDLEPYICLFEDCTSPRELFSSAEQWLAHMKAHPAPSAEWICAMHHASSNQIVMKTAEEFANHIRDMHSGRFTDMQIKKLLIRAARPGPIFSSCPFCDWLEHPDPEKPKVSGGPTPIEEHIADHLFDLALLSLPPMQNNETSDEEIRDSLANVSIVSANRHITSLLFQALMLLAINLIRLLPGIVCLPLNRVRDLFPQATIQILKVSPGADGMIALTPAHGAFKEDLIHHIKITHGGVVVDNAEVHPFKIFEELEQKALQTSGQPLICRWDDCPQRESFFSSHSLLFHIDRDHVVPENGDYSGSIRNLDPSMMSAPKNPKDYYAVFNDHFEIEPPRRENSMEELPGQESEMIKCICGLNHDDGQTIYCEKCNTWQHIVCYYGDRQFPDEHMCGDCQPRPLNSHRARALQEAQLEAASAATRREEENRKTRKRRRRKDRDLGEAGSDSRAASSPLPRRNEPGAEADLFPNESAPVRKRRRQIPSAPVYMSTDISEKEPPSKKPPRSEHQEL
ncbi:hypothetical protein ASPACDRAFT_64957 [Aspergillus aculeatus ATCC 16872]|uniref:C2H2-type domain-containing protein n=1 Tax=Aspergillus aculeatus (strain ATCC 16872 / CBS 172.66 / WB 5094) TaxID=690307 RepID=A0A1L9WFD8_ASPA1|nr:uncharacterized protein ASPACDRAFT_64957 [Aspergillus aculeatus ATCC 16872]OJJ94807.1 hypothetical protein ASPACDRAFT_64957 [Aspergillus aculeatus ATCC 16872]